MKPFGGFLNVFYLYDYFQGPATQNTLFLLLPLYSLTPHHQISPAALD